MHAFFLLFFVSLSLFAQVKSRIDVIPNPQGLEDFDHLFKGCPENSECDQVMGQQLTKWSELISKLRTPKEEVIDDQKKAQYIELFRAKYGIPVKFYTYQKSQLGFKPVLFNSPCKEHNPKESGQKIFEGIGFVKNISKDKTTVWRDQTQIDIPNGELIIPQPVQVFYDASPTLYHLPLSDQPLFIKDKELVVLREDEGFFFALKVSATGDWKVVGLDLKNLSQWENKRENVQCPVQKMKVSIKPFQTEFCKTVWDEDLKKTVIVKMFEGCTI